MIRPRRTYPEPGNGPSAGERSGARTVVITGAAGGIGAALAARLVETGASLFLADVDGKALDRLVRDLDCRSVEAMAADVVDPGACRRIARRARSALGAVDALVNCAGVVAPGRLDRVDVEDHRRLLEVNLLGAVNLSHAFVRLFREQARGHLVHVASLAGLAPLPEEAVYAASKFGVRGLCLSLDLELRDTPIRVTSVCPDSVRTSMLEAEARGQGSPLAFGGRLLDPGEVADAIVGALRRPRRELLVPSSRGALVRLTALLPGLIDRLLPWLRRQGERGRREYLDELDLGADGERPDAASGSHGSTNTLRRPGNRGGNPGGSPGDVPRPVADHDPSSLTRERSS